MQLRPTTVPAFAHERLVERILPFAGVAMLAFVLVPLPPAEDQPLLVVLGAGLMAAIVAAAFVVPWARLPLIAQALPPIAYLPVVVLLREAEGGAMSGYAPLVLLPVIWLALYGRKGELAIAIALISLCLSLPIMLVGAPAYPPSEWRRMFLVASISAVIGFTVQQLVRRQGALSEQLAELALADALTQLPNRRAWDHRLQAEILRTNRRGAALCVAQLDLDHFKRFNDELGHTAGDDLLRPCAAEWLRALRGADFLARHGGDEFVILLPDCTLDEALDVTERVRAATRAAQQCSIGVDEWVPGEDGASLVARADTALYRAKASGRDQVGSDADGTAWAGLTAS